MNGRTFTTVNTTVMDLLVFAYGIHPTQVLGAPAWLSTEQFDITGEPDAAGRPTLAQWKQIVGKLLPSRFALTFHRDTKDLAVNRKTFSKLARRGRVLSEGNTNRQSFSTAWLDKSIIYALGPPHLESE